MTACCRRDKGRKEMRGGKKRRRKRRVEDDGGEIRGQTEMAVRRINRVIIIQAENSL